MFTALRHRRQVRRSLKLVKATHIGPLACLHTWRRPAALSTVRRVPSEW